MAAHIARLALDGGEGGFWERFAVYHSRTPEHRDRYLRLLAGQAERLLSRGRGSAVATAGGGP